MLTLSTYDLDALFRNYPQDGLLILRGLTDSIVYHLMKTNQQLQEAKSQIAALKQKLAEHANDE
ncbi:MAG: hypothetical protein D6820_13710 [Lentisphaerae bacterium]|nr:MAG: hypothetical protein D6820_13710 [Lentisphaerota bacterium]